MKSLKIGIIGAGISGLSCAQQLTLAGHHVVLFDKSRGVGGRMSHRTYETWGADHGAQYFTAKDLIFQNEVQNWVGAGVASSWDSKIVTLSEGRVTESNEPRVRYVGVPKMSSPAKHLAQNLNLELSKTIIEIASQNGQWELISKEAGLLPYQFDFIVIAIPPIQAQKIVGKHSQLLANQFKNVKMFPCWTLLAYLKKPLDFNFDGAFVNHSVFSWLARDNAKPGRSTYETWVAQASPTWSEEHVDLSQYVVDPLLLKAFRDLTGVECDLYQTHLWRYAKLETESHINFVMDSQKKLALCGDWLKTSTVEGAWTSGYLLANEIIGITLK